jgi:purine-binding chemotaxis protein CheW
MTELFLIARIAGRGVAIATDQVRSVVDIGEVVAVPGAIGAIRGLAALRSRVVTVVDTGLALGLDPTTEGATRAIITRVDGHEYALLVEELADVAPFDRQPLSGVARLDRGWALAGVGLIDHDGEPLLILDVAALVPVMANAA